MSLICCTNCGKLIEYSSPSSFTCQSCTDKINHAKEFLKQYNEKVHLIQGKSSANIQIIINGIEFDLFSL